MWDKSMNREVDTLEDNDTYDIVDISEIGDAIPIESRWIFTIKPSLDLLDPKRFKSRIVAKGFQQSEGIDFFNTYSPTLKMVSSRILFALTAQLQYHIRHFDVVSAFTNATLDETIYLLPPEGLAEKIGKNKVLKLKKCLYGLRQSPFKWNQHITQLLISKGFKQLASDNCVFVYTNPDGTLQIISIYVDDMKVIAKTLSEIDSIFDFLSQHLQMKNLGAPTRYLGVGVKVTNTGSSTTIQLEQSSLIAELAGLTEVKSLSTPMPSKAQAVTRFPFKKDVKSYRVLIAS
jgi:hypothetical protein